MFAPSGLQATQRWLEARQVRRPPEQALHSALFSQLLARQAVLALSPSRKPEGAGLPAAQAPNAPAPAKTTSAPNAARPDIADFAASADFAAFAAIAAPRARKK